MKTENYLRSEYEARDQEDQEKKEDTSKNESQRIVEKVTRYKLQQLIRKHHIKDSATLQKTRGKMEGINSESNATLPTEELPKEVLQPALGIKIGNKAYVREDLPPRAKRFVSAHEQYHLTDEHTWGGVFGKELRANVIPAMKDPLGALSTMKQNLSMERIKFYMNRIRNKN